MSILVTSFIDFRLLQGVVYMESNENIIMEGVMCFQCFHGGRRMRCGISLVS